jgi:RNA polymerase sigma-70 factor (ECF subfamily)
MHEIVKAAQAGDRVAWNFLYRQHYPWMYATALHICGNSPAAKDAVQETFVTAYLKLQQLKDATAFAGWLKTILVRFCGRNKNHQFTQAGRLASLDSNNTGEDEINKAMDGCGRNTKIYHCLSHLSDALQSVLLLRYFSEWSSYEQIAALLHIPVGTVRSRLNQAKQKLAQHWKESNDDNDSAFRKAAEWNHLYYAYFANIYTSLPYREKLIAHFDKNLQIVFTSGKTAVGRGVVQQLIEDDMVYGNSFGSVEVSSSNNISIIECSNINPSEYPDRCPESTVFVLQRTGKVAARMNLHNSR